MAGQRSRSSTDPRNVTDDAIGGRAYYVARAELEIPLGASVRDLGLRPSHLRRRRRGVRRPLAEPARHRSGQSARLQPVHGSTAGGDDAPHAAAPCNPAPRRSTRVAHRAVPRALPRRLAEPARLGRLRRQLELALRAVPHRHRPRAAQRAGRRHQALHVQRRNSILMKTKILLGAACRARRHRPDGRCRPRPLPAPVVAVVDTDQIFGTCTHCAAAKTQLQAQVTQLQQRAQQRCSRSRPRARRSSRGPRAARRPARRRAGRAHPDAFQTTQQNAQREIAAAQEHIQRNVDFVRQQIGQRIQPAIADRACSSAARPSPSTRGAGAGDQRRASTSPTRCSPSSTRTPRALNVNAPPPPQPRRHAGRRRPAAAATGRARRAANGRSGERSGSAATGVPSTSGG